MVQTQVFSGLHSGICFVFSSLTGGVYMNKEITELLKKVKSQQKQWKRPSNQSIQEMIGILERLVK